MKLFSPFLSFAVALIFAGCGERAATPAPESPTTKATNADPKIYYVRGIVKELQLDAAQVIIDHEEIPKYMKAMTMPFVVSNTNDFTSITTNDQIHFRLVVESKRSWIDQIEKVGHVLNLTNQNRPMFRLVREVEPLSEGDILPDYPFTNSYGKAFNTADYRGQVLAITLIFTRCPLPDFCPRMSENFKDLYQLLQRDSAGPTNWHLLSLSFDPEFDTGSVLQAYARQFDADPKKWSFATGALIEIDDITERLGMYFSREATGFTFNHNLRTIIIDPYGRIHKILIGNTWNPGDALQAIHTAASAEPPEKTD